MNCFLEWLLTAFHDGDPKVTGIALRRVEFLQYAVLPLGECKAPPPKSLCQVTSLEVVVTGLHKFLWKVFCLVGKNATETVVILGTAYKDAAVGKYQMYNWCSLYKKGEMSINEWSTSFWTSINFPNGWKYRRICKLMLEYSQYTIDEIKELSGVSWNSVQQTLLEDKKMGRVSAKFVSWLLTDQLEEGRMSHGGMPCIERTYKNYPQFLEKIVLSNDWLIEWVRSYEDRVLLTWYGKEENDRCTELKKMFWIMA